MSVKIIQKERKAPVLRGIKNHETITLCCSNCDKPLMDVMVLDPNAKNPDGSDMEWRLQALCCYCNDKSFVKEVKGRFVPGAYGTPNPDDPDDYFMQTNLGRMETLEDRVVFHIHKVK
jgi:hypothetical protein